MTRARNLSQQAADRERSFKRTSASVPEEILSALEPGERIEAGFNMGEGLEIYATGRRFFGRRGGHLVGIRYAEVSEARRRTSEWRTWRGIARIAIGIAFVAAGALTGFQSPQSMILSLGLFLFGGALVLLGLYRRDDWVELKIERREPPPSFWYIVVFLPFWLMLRSRTRYRVPGNPEDVDAFYDFLSARLPSHPQVGQ